jgi:hypothetical protein
LCRLDPTPPTLGQPQPVETMQPTACDPGNGIIGSPGQIVYDNGYVYVPDVAVRSPGVWRLPFDVATETLGKPELLAPGAGLDNARIIGLALGPDGNLYAAGLKNGSIYRITNPRGAPGQQSTQVAAQTTDGRGINGTLGFVGNDLYLPENRGMSVVKGATGCVFCSAMMLPLTGLTFGQSIATNGTDTVYVSTAAGGSSAVILRYKPASGAVDVYATSGVLPASGSPAAQEYCSETCLRAPDPGTPFGGTLGFHFAIGMYVDPTSRNLLVGDDPLAGARGFHGHVWSVPYTP